MYIETRTVSGGRVRGRKSKEVQGIHSFNVLPGCLPESLLVLVPTSAAYENAPFL